jgi:hypothetical protein
MAYPPTVFHWIGGDRPSVAGESFEKKDPTTGRTLGLVARGRPADAQRCIELAADHV